MEYVNPLADQPNPANYQHNLNSAPSYLQSAVAGENLERSAPFLDMAKQGAQSDLNKKLLENSEFGSPEAVGQRSMQRQSETAKAKYERDIMPGKTVAEMAANEQAAKSAPVKGDAERAQLANQLLDSQNAPHAELLGRIAGLGEQWKKNPTIGEAEKKAQWDALMQEHKIKWGDRATTDPTMSQYGPHVPTIIDGATGAVVHTAKHIQTMAQEELKGKNELAAAQERTRGEIGSASVHAGAQDRATQAQLAIKGAELESDPKRMIPKIVQRIGTDKESPSDKLALSIAMHDRENTDVQIKGIIDESKEWLGLANNSATTPEKQAHAQRMLANVQARLKDRRAELWKDIPWKMRPDTARFNSKEEDLINRAKQAHPNLSIQDIIKQGVDAGELK